MNNSGLAHEWSERGIALFPDDVEFKKLPTKIRMILSQSQMREAKVCLRDLFNICILSAMEGSVCAEE